MSKMKTLKYLLLSLVLFVAALQSTYAQYDNFKIVMQVTSSDTLVHKSLMKQLNNMLSVAPSTQVEVVCHGPGLDMMVAAKARYADGIAKHSANGVTFRVCEFSMKERNVAFEQLLLQANPVKAGILHIVSRQSEGWHYIKAGF